MDTETGEEDGSAELSKDTARHVPSQQVPELGWKSFKQSKAAEAVADPLAKLNRPTEKSKQESARNDLKKALNQHQNSSILV